MIKRLIFDVDGTLITGTTFDQAINETLKKLNLYSEENAKRFFSGIATYEDNFNNYNTNDYLHYMENALGCILPNNFLDIFFEELKFIIPTKNIELIHSIEKLSEKYELVLLTNFFKKSQLNRLNNMGIGHFFTECYGEELLKPNTDAYLNACGNNKPNECVMIGDNINLDIKSAQQVGLNTIFVNSKNISINDLNCIIVNSVLEINDKLIEMI